MQSIKARIGRIRRAPGGIRFRLTVWYALVLGGVLVLIGLLLYEIELRTRAFTLDSRLTNQAHVLREYYTPQTGQITPPDQTNSELALRNGEFLLLFDAQGNLAEQIGMLATSDVAWFDQNLTSLTRGTTGESFLNY